MPHPDHCDTKPAAHWAMIPRPDTVICRGTCDVVSAFDTWPLFSISVERDVAGRSSGAPPLAEAVALFADSRPTTNCRSPRPDRVVNGAVDERLHLNSGHDGVSVRARGCRR